MLSGEILELFQRARNLVLTSVVEDWSGYDYETELQSLTSLTRSMEEYEVNINLIRHAKGAHCHHPARLLTMILENGYGYWLCQHGSSYETWNFAAPGSIITMEPWDGHRIPELKVPSLSLCIVSHHFSWAAQRPAISSERAQVLLARAQVALAELRGSV